MWMSASGCAAFHVVAQAHSGSTLLTVCAMAPLRSPSPTPPGSRDTFSLFHDQLRGAHVPVRDGTRVSRHDDLALSAVFGGRAVFRPEQSAERATRVPNASHGTLRHLLLPRGGTRHAAGGADGRALVRSILAALRPHVHPSP